MSIGIRKRAEKQTVYLKSSLKNISTILGNQSRLFLGTLGFTLVVILGIIDYATGYDLSFSLFYLAPISLVSWFGDRRLGVLISLFSAMTWFTADFANGRLYANPVIYLWNTLIRLGFFVIVTLLITKLRRTLKEEQELARTDFLTQTVNTRHFYDLGQLEIYRARRYQHPFTLVYIDLDNFKTINDIYGHSTGDRVLQTVAKIMQKHIRTTDLVARLGGDEFAILLSETGAEWAHQFIDRIHMLLSEEMVANNWLVTFSIGVVTFKNPPPSMDELIKIADDQMYTVKSNHKNGVSFSEY